MNPIFRKLQAFVSNQALTLCRAPTSIQHPVWAYVTQRQHRGRPTSGIGKWSYLVIKEVVRKKRDKHPMEKIIPATDKAYGSLNVNVSGYDMTLVEHYSQYIHNLCNRLRIRVSSYALPTQSTEVTLAQEKNTKMLTNTLLKTHRRVIQLNTLKTTLCPVFLEVVLKNQPEGVEVSVKDYVEADFHARFKRRLQLEGLLAQIHASDPRAADTQSR